MNAVMETIDSAPVNPQYKQTSEHPINWIVFTLCQGMRKRQFIRIHPNYISESEDFYFKDSDLKAFEDAWYFIADGEIEESRLEAVRPYVTFILNKTAHLYLESREEVVEDIQNGVITLIDYFITNN